MFYGAYTHHIIICFMHLEYKCGKRAFSMIKYDPLWRTLKEKESASTSLSKIMALIKHSFSGFGRTLL